MTELELKLSLPDQLANQAKAAGLLTSESIERLVREAIRKVAELAGKGPRVYSDNAGVARFLQRTIEALLYKEFAAESLPVMDAEFERTGNSLSTVEERVVSRDGEIVLAWWDLMEPFVLTMPPGAMNRLLGVYSTFLPARSAQLSVNGKAAAAKVFLQDRFGKPASSCCLAWSETWTRPRA